MVSINSGGNSLPTPQKDTDNDNPNPSLRQRPHRNIPPARSPIKLNAGELVWEFFY